MGFPSLGMWLETLLAFARYFVKRNSTRAHVGQTDGVYIFHHRQMGKLTLAVVFSNILENSLATLQRVAVRQVSVMSPILCGTPL